MENNLQLLHFQITKSCNLRCPFCGQWGNHGFFRNENGVEMTLSDWENVIEQLASFDKKPDVILWGGEPLVSPHFAEIVMLLKQYDFTLGIVTNGVFIDKYANILNTAFKTIYVSIDGGRELHDSIRGTGVFEKVTENLQLLQAERVTIMTVFTPQLDVKPFAEKFKDYNIYLHDMIPFEGQKVEIYHGDIPKNVLYLHHGENAKNKVCLAPYKHLHITWNGEVNFCTDFYDYSIGNVKNENIYDIFTGEKAEVLRNRVRCGGYDNCNHCSWRNNSTFRL